MNTDDPADISALSYGTGLALGLFLILGLPSEPRSGRGGSPRRITPAAKLAVRWGPFDGALRAQVEGPQVPSTRTSIAA